MASPGIGLGTTFTVELPRNLRSETKSDAESRSLPLYGVHLLLVDDDQVSLQMFEMLLAAQGAHVSTTGSAKEAIALVPTIANALWRRGSTSI